MQGAGKEYIGDDVEEMHVAVKAAIQVNRKGLHLGVSLNRPQTSCLLDPGLLCPAEGKAPEGGGGQGAAAEEDQPPKVRPQCLQRDMDGPGGHGGGGGTARAQASSSGGRL